MQKDMDSIIHSHGINGTLYDFIKTHTPPWDQYMFRGRCMTFLHEAANYGDVKATRLLLASGMDANVVNWRNETPLHYARNAEVVRLLLARGGDPKFVSDNYQSPIITMCMYHAMDCVIACIENGHIIAQPCFNSLSEIIHDHQMARQHRQKRAVLLCAFKRRRIATMAHLDRFLIGQLALAVIKANG